MFTLDEECEYCPDKALSAALHDWMEELSQPLQAGKTTLNVMKLDWTHSHDL